MHLLLYFVVTALAAVASARPDPLPEALAEPQTPVGGSGGDGSGTGGEQNNDGIATGASSAAIQASITSAATAAMPSSMTMSAAASAATSTKSSGAPAVATLTSSGSHQMLRPNWAMAGVLIGGGLLV